MECFFALPRFFYGIGGIVSVLIFLYSFYLMRYCGLILAPLQRLLCLFVAALMAGGLNCGIFLTYTDPLAGMADETVSITGTVISVESKYIDSYDVESEPDSNQQANYHKITVSVSGIHPMDYEPDSNDNLATSPALKSWRFDPPGPFTSFAIFSRVKSKKTLLRVFGTDIDPKVLIGAEINATGLVSLPDPRRNPKCFDYRMHLKTIGIHTLLTCSDTEVSLVAGSRYTLPGLFLNAIGNLRISVIEQLRNHLDSDHVSLFTGMLFGDKSGIDEDVYESWQKNGIAHILSVSGLHMAMVYAFIVRLTGNRKGLFQSIVSIICLFCYAALAQFSPSVTRAGIMILTHITARLLKKRYDLPTGAGLAAGIILAANPLQLFNVGFQLSFLAIRLYCQ